MSFARFPEQRQVAGLLQRSLERGRLGHAYLFSGHDIGELESMALTLAKTLNCLKPIRAGGGDGVAVDCCDNCSVCQRIDQFNHPDVTLVRPESKSRVITIEQTRDLIQILNLKPSEAEFKVGIIAGAERMNLAAANAFLKTLEEPPSRSILILLTTTPQRILETILSRCLRLTFAGEHRLRPDDFAWVAAFSEAAAKESRGGLLPRYLLLGRLAAQLTRQRTEIEEQFRSRSLLERHEDADPKLRERWEEELSAAVESEYRRQRSELLASLQSWVRDVWLMSFTSGIDLVALPQLVEFSKSVAARLTPAEAMENLNTLEQLQRWLGTNAQEALVLEVGLLKLKL